MVLAEPIDDSAGSSAAVLGRYEAALAETVATVGVESLAESTAIDRDTLEAVAAGEAAELPLAAAAAILATTADETAEQLLTDCRDRLLLGMSSAMLTVDRLAADLDEELDPKEIQAKIEGRHPMTLGEYARFHHHIVAAT